MFIANPYLNDDPGTIIMFPDETFGLNGRKFRPKGAEPVGLMVMIFEFAEHGISF
jgi:hypothetical protein